MKNGRYENVTNITESLQKESKNHNSDFASHKPQPLNLFKNLKKFAKNSAKLKILNSTKTKFSLKTKNILSQKEIHIFPYIFCHNSFIYPFHSAIQQHQVN